MTQLDIVFFLVAGLAGVSGRAWRSQDPRWAYGDSVAWFIVALWAFLKLVKVL